MAVLSMPCFRALWKTVFVKGDIVYYESSDFLETADSDTLKQIARTRELTRKYYFLIMEIQKNALPFFGSCWAE